MKLVVPSSGSMIQTNSEFGAVLAARFLGQDAVAGVGREQGLDDGLLAGVVHLGHVVVDLFLRDAHSLHVQGRAVDDGAGGGRPLMATLSMGCRLDDIDCAGVRGGLWRGRGPGTENTAAGDAGGDNKRWILPARLWCIFTVPLTAPACPKTRFILINTSHAGNVGAAPAP